MKYRKILTAVGLVAIVILGALFIYQRSHTVTAPPQLPPKSATVVINEDGFSPSSLRVARGTVVIWQNQDGQAHGIKSGPFGQTPALPGFDSRTNLDTNGSYRYTFLTSGTYTYYDPLHPTTNGTVIVQ